MQGFDTSEAVTYHYGAFPPKALNYNIIASPLAEARAAIATYEQMLKGLHNARLFLTPLARREALSSSRMEGTISTLDELLAYEASIADGKASAREDTLEVHAYRIAMNKAEELLDGGTDLSSDLLCAVHERLLRFTRGSGKSPGKFKTNQNYLVSGNKVRFTPIAPDRVEPGLAALFSFVNESEHHPLIKAAIAHLEFEALHPFNDGNGRIGRILITLMLWRLNLLSRPYFYISGYLETKKDDYVEHMRAVSVSKDWTPWCLFFLEAVRAQAEANLSKAEEIRALYEEMKEAFRVRLSSKWAIDALDFAFEHPVFWNSTFTKESGVPAQTAHSFTRKLLRAGILDAIQSPAGRRPGLYAFEPLLQILRDP